MKKNKLTKLLKNGILFLSISLLLFNCEKETNENFSPTSYNITIDETIVEFSINFNSENFRFIPKKPIWKDVKEFEINGRKYLEIPFHKLKNEDLRKNNAIIYYKLLVYKNNYNKIIFNVVKYFALDLDNSTPNFNQLSFKNIDKFNGFVTLLDNNNEAIEVKRYNNGIKSNIEYKYSFEELDKDNRHLGYRAPSEEPCRGEVVSYQCTRICQWYGNEDNIIYCWPYSCTITGYKPANDSDCAQGEIGGSSTVEQTLLEEDDDQIFNELTGKDLCIFNELKKLDLFKSTISKFSSGKYNLTFKYGTTCNNQAGEEACTDPKDLANGNLTIKILGSGSQSLDFAATLLHEGIHAEIYKYVDEHKKGIDPNDRKNLFFYYNLYSAQNNNRKETSLAQHQHMQDVFVTPIARVIRQLDGNRHNIDYYKGFAFEGIIKKYGYDKYWDNGVLKTMTPDIYKSYENKMYNVISTTKFKDALKNCN